MTKIVLRILPFALLFGSASAIDGEIKILTNHLGYEPAGPSMP